VHPYTLAAIYGGLRALTSSLGLDDEWRAALTAIQAYVLEQGVHDGRLVKSIGNLAVDASLIGVTTPYRLLEPHSPLMRATVACIETNLRREGGGVHRYVADTYYGGGEWVLLTARKIRHPAAPSHRDDVGSHTTTLAPPPVPLALPARTLPRSPQATRPPPPPRATP